MIEHWFPDGIPAQLLVSTVVIAVVINVILMTIAYSIYLERKISAYIQDRIGPNRVGFDFGLPFLSFLKGKLGLGQPMADGLKFLLKEDYTPTRVDSKLFTLAPMIIIVPALMGFVIIPWGGTWTIDDFSILGIAFQGGEVTIAGAAVNVGIIYILAVASLGVYGITLGGWASNNKYSFLGGLRATAQMVSYEIPMGLSIMAVLLLIGTLAPVAIVEYQLDHGWLIFAQPIAAVLFFASILAESNRAPFDNAEAEQELVGGYHTEYSSMRFALFFLAEYGHMITGCAFFVLLFLGGWDAVPFLGLLPEHAGPGWGGFAIVMLKFMVYFGKVVSLVCFMQIVRWTLPRLRYDQVMMLGWGALIPISLAVVVMTSVMVYLGDNAPLVGDATAWWVMLGANAVLFAVILVIMPHLGPAGVDLDSCNNPARIN